MKRDRRFAQVAILLLFLISSPAIADIFDYTDLLYSFSRDYVPDFDQVRAEYPYDNIIGLPNNGNMYCVPTSSMNWMAYIAEHGYSSVPPGVGYWQGSPPDYLAEYNHIGLKIFMMGFYMGTDPYLGATSSPQPPVQDWLDTAAPDHFSVYEVYANGGYVPRVKDAALASISGALVNIYIGWYTEPWLDQRRHLVGGHTVSLVGADGLFSTLSVNDPWTEYGIPAGVLQSPFKADDSTFEPIFGSFCFNNILNVPECYVRTQDRLNYVMSGYMEGYLAVIPKYGLSYIWDELIWLNPNIFSALLKDPIRRMTPFPGKKILDAAINPIKIQHPIIVEGSDTIWLIDSLLGTSKEFAVVENPKRLIYGGKKEHLYVLSSDRISRLDRDGRLDREVSLRAPLDEIAFDEKGQQLIGVSQETSELFVFSPDLEELATIPLERDVVGEKERLSISINPKTGEVGVFFVGAAHYTLLELAERELRKKEKISFPAEVLSAESFYLDEYGNAFVSDRGQIIVMNSDGKISENSPFTGLPGGEGILIHRSFSNFDPATMPQMRNVTPEEAKRLTQNPQ